MDEKKVENATGRDVEGEVFIVPRPARERIGKQGSRGRQTGTQKKAVRIWTDSRDHFADAVRRRSKSFSGGQDGGPKDGKKAMVETPARRVQIEMDLWRWGKEHENNNNN